MSAPVTMSREAVAVACGADPAAAVPSFGWWVVCEHATDEGRDHAFGPFKTNAAAAVFLAGSPRMETYRRVPWLRCMVLSERVDHHDLAAYGYTVAGFIYPWTGDYAGPGEPPEAMPHRAGMRVDPDYWRVNTPVLVPIPARVACLDCGRADGTHRWDCETQVPPCGCGLGDCGWCGRRPGAARPYAEGEGMRLPSAYTRP